MTRQSWAMGRGFAFGSSSMPGGARRELRAAAESIDGARRGLDAADDVDWVSPAARGYRAVLAEGSAVLRGAQGVLDEAITSVALHDTAVERGRLARHAALVAGTPLGALDGPSLASWQDITGAVDVRAGLDGW